MSDASQECRAPGAVAPEPLTPAAAAHAYQAVFAAIAYGKNRVAALVLRDLEPEHLTELAVICGDVQIMVEAEQRRRAELEGSGS
jgi:hypothetical protein